MAEGRTCTTWCQDFWKVYSNQNSIKIGKKKKKYINNWLMSPEVYRLFNRERIIISTNDTGATR